MCGICGCDDKQTHEHHHHHHDDKMVKIEQDLFTENNHYAGHNRDYFKQHHILTLNLVSSPGSGKTTLLTKTINSLNQQLPITVIEGDQQTDYDAKCIEQTGVPVLQINTGHVCHLDAHRIGHAVTDLTPPDNSMLFIENVGNLVCPAFFDLGEKHKVVILSVTEGDNKPLKYPNMFNESSLMLINKIDLLPYVDFNMEKCIEYAKRINPDIQAIPVSATQQQGLAPWLEWLVSEMDITNNHSAAA